MRIGLLTTIDNNIGDDFIREGIIHVLQTLAAGQPLEFVSVNKHKPHTIYPRSHPIRLVYDGKKICPRPLRRLTESMLHPFGRSHFDNCGLLIQCGTPVIWNGCRNSEWAKRIWQNVLARLAGTGRAVLNLGGGSCYPWERQPQTLLGDPDENFIRLMLKTSRVTIARDELAKKLFATLGFETPRLCCPAMLTGQSHVKPSIPAQKVIVNYMAGGGHYDFGQGIDPQKWEQTMSDVVKAIILRGWQPCLLAHNQPELGLAKKIWPGLPATMPQTTREYFETIRDAAFGIVNRMHAAVALAGLGIPSVSVGADTRNLMVATLGLPVFYVKEATVERLLASFDDLAARRADESRRLLVLRETTFAEYKNYLQPFLTSGLA